MYISDPDLSDPQFTTPFHPLERSQIMPARSYRAFAALHDEGWAKYGHLGYRAGWYSTIDMTGIDRSDNTIISLDRDIFIIKHELMKGHLLFFNNV